MSDVTIVTSEAEAPIAEQPASETVTVEATEAITDAAVEVAQIEAARDVAIAEVYAETEQTAIAAVEEQTTELQACQRSIEVLTTGLASLSTEVQSIREALTLLTNPQNPPAAENSEVTPEFQEAAREPDKKLRKTRFM